MRCFNCGKKRILNIEGWCADCWILLHGTPNNLFLYNEEVTKGKIPIPDDDNNRFNTRK
jgi:hypothetical protein